MLNAPPIFLTKPTDTTLYSADAAGWANVKRDYNDEANGYGQQVYRWVYNSSGVDIPANATVKFKSGSNFEVLLATTATPTVQVAGIMQNALPNGYCGWALCEGKGLFTSDTDVAANAPLSVSSASSGVAGRLDDIAVAGIEHCLLGYSIEAATGVQNKLGMFKIG